MSKKILALALTLVMALTLSAAVFAEGETKNEGTQQVTTTVEPLYTVTIPAATSVPFYQERSDLGNVTVEVSPAWDFAGKELVISLEGSNNHKFVCTDPNVKTTIDYMAGNEYFGAPYLTFTETTRTRTFMARIKVLKAAWDAAEPGSYTTTITYTSEIVEAAE